MATSRSQFVDIENFGTDLNKLIANSNIMVPKAIVIAADTEYNSSTILPRGLLLAPLTASGLYVPFDSTGEDGEEISANVVVLLENVDCAGANTPSRGLHMGYVYKDAVLGDYAGLTLANVQRLNFVDPR